LDFHPSPSLVQKCWNCPCRRHYAMKLHRGIRVQIQSYCTSALDGSEWSASRPGRIVPWKIPVTHYTRGSVGTRTGLGDFEENPLPLPGPKPETHEGIYSGSRGIAPLILTLGTRWSGQLHAPADWTEGKTPVSTEWDLGWAPEPVWAFWRTEIFLPLSGREPRIVQPVASIMCENIK